MSKSPRFLVIDGYSPEGREELQKGGAGVAADLYSAMLERCHPGSTCDRIFPSDPGGKAPSKGELDEYDGVAWTGCSLTIYDNDPRVHRLIDIAKTAYELGVPSFGSCWGAQMAVYAAGGRVAQNPNGREMGLARKIILTPEGRGHPLYAGKRSVFDGFTSHEDEITHLPPGGVALSYNAWTRVQSVAVTHQKGEFWALQYHPEYDLHEMARLTFCRVDRLVKKGFFRDRDAALDFVDQLETLHKDPSRREIAWLLGIDEDVMNEDVRVREVRNWIDFLVLPAMDRRRA